MSTEPSFYQELRRVLEERAASDGLTMTEVIALDPPLSRFIRRFVRATQMTGSEMASIFGLTPGEAEQLGKLLVAKGLAHTITLPGGEPAYRPHLVHSRQRARTADVWDKLQE